LYKDTQYYENVIIIVHVRVENVGGGSFSVHNFDVGYSSCPSSAHERYYSYMVY